MSTDRVLSLQLTCVLAGAQLLGFSDVAVATISTCLTLGLALGFLMGGSAGDWLAMRFPNAARPAINQLSLLLSMPMSAVLYKAMPGASAYRSWALDSCESLHHCRTQCACHPV